MASSLCSLDERLARVELGFIVSQIAGTCIMKLSDLTLEELKALVKGIVDDRLRELLGDPDLGMEMGVAIRARLKESLTSSARLTGEDVAEQLGLRWSAWYRLANRPEVVGDLAKIEKAMAQRLLDKTKWLASNVENLRHEPILPDLPGLSKYAVGEWRIFYSIDQEEYLVDVHLIGRSTDLNQRSP